MSDKRCFLQWFVLLLSFATITFFAGYYGLLRMVWETDVTHMTSVIGGVFIAAIVYLGIASWRYDNPRRFIATAIADTGVGKTASYIVTLIGLLGTVIGLTLQVKAMANINLSDQANMIAFVKAVSSSLGTAFYATGCGIIGSIGIIAMTANLEYFIDRDEVTQ